MRGTVTTTTRVQKETITEESTARKQQPRLVKMKSSVLFSSLNNENYKSPFYIYTPKLRYRKVSRIINSSVIWFILSLLFYFAVCGEYHISCGKYHTSWKIKMFAVGPFLIVILDRGKYIRWFLAFLLFPSGKTSPKNRGHGLAFKSSEPQPFSSFTVFY